MKSFLDKRGQVTIFIIVGLIIVVGIIAYFSLYLKPTSTISPKENPQGFIEGCIGDALEVTQDKILPMGGYRTPTKFLEYNNTKVQYLCYVDDNYKLCESLEPMLKQKLEAELKQDTTQKVENCFIKLENSFSGYDYSDGATNYNVEILPGKLTARVKKQIEISKDGNTQKFEDFIYEEASPVFDFVVLTQEIISKEIDCDCQKESCNANLFEMAQLNPEYRITVFVSGENEKVYSITEYLSSKRYQFAMRNCVKMP